MSLFELFILSIGLSMDAFTVSVGAGLCLPKQNNKQALIIGLYFGLFQAIMPLVGYKFTTQFAEKIVSYDHWVVFALLCYIGGKMIIESFNKHGYPYNKPEKRNYIENMYPVIEESGSIVGSIKPNRMIPLAIATSIDALAVGVTFAFLKVKMYSSIIFIGLTTFVLSFMGVKIGNKFSSKYKSKAELIGGVILILIGAKVLLEHLGVMR